MCNRNLHDEPDCLECFLAIKIGYTEALLDLHQTFIWQSRQSRGQDLCMSSKGTGLDMVSLAKSRVVSL